MENGISGQGVDFIIWVDADACPVQVRDLILRTALRRRIRCVFVANAYMRLPDSEWLEMRQVPGGENIADDYIVEHAGQTDIAITGDIPLAARLAERNILTLNHRGEELTSATVGERLAMRNLMEDLRSAGIPTGGPKELGRADLQKFANALDRAVTARTRR
ncbi:MAG: YaiI/YqxD family protein [Planctomycetes bacterium]|nr:YaiI/YqxD family protein [Planctomycetota bacterium]